MRPGQLDGMKLLGQRSLIVKMVHDSRERVHDCQPHGGRERGGMTGLTEVNR
jgi:hypothetical protein